jgi:hypothetical protein
VLYRCLCALQVFVCFMLFTSALQVFVCFTSVCVLYVIYKCFTGVCVLYRCLCALCYLQVFVCFTSVCVLCVIYRCFTSICVLYVIYRCLFESTSEISSRSTKKIIDCDDSRFSVRLSVRLCIWWSSIALQFKEIIDYNFVF